MLDEGITNFLFLPMGDLIILCEYCRTFYHQNDDLLYKYQISNVWIFFITFGRLDVGIAFGGQDPP